MNLTGSISLTPMQVRFYRRTLLFAGESRTNRGRAIWYPPLLGTPGYLHPVRKASSPPSFVTLNSPRGPVSGGGWEGRPPLCSPAMTRLLPSALGSHPLCVATSSAVDQRGRAPGAPARANHPRPRRMRLREWLTPVGESPRISGFHGKLLL